MKLYIKIYSYMNQELLPGLRIRKSSFYKDLPSKKWDI